MNYLKVFSYIYEFINLSSLKIVNDVNELDKNKIINDNSRENSFNSVIIHHDCDDLSLFDIMLKELKES